MCLDVPNYKPRDEFPIRSTLLMADYLLPFVRGKAILEGFRNQLRVDKKLAVGVYGLGCDVEADLILQEQCEEWFNMRIAEEINVVQGQPQYRDAITDGCCIGDGDSYVWKPRESHQRHEACDAS